MMLIKSGRILVCFLKHNRTLSAYVGLCAPTRSFGPAPTLSKDDEIADEEDDKEVEEEEEEDDDDEDDEKKESCLFFNS